MNDANARDLIDGVRDLVRLFSTPLVVTTFDSTTSREVFLGFSGNDVIGTTKATLWTPSTGRRFVLRGFSITAVVQTVLAASDPSTLRLTDSGNTTTVAPVGSYDATAAAGTIITGSAGPLTVNLHEGVRGSVVGSTLQLTASNDIGTGRIRYAGVVWGIEETA